MRPPPLPSTGTIFNKVLINEFHNMLKMGICVKHVYHTQKKQQKKKKNNKKTKKQTDIQQDNRSDLLSIMCSISKAMLHHNTDFP